MTIDPDEIEALAQAPKTVQNEEGRVTERSIDEVIKADRHAASKQENVRRPPWGMNIAIAKPGGMMGRPDS